MGSPVSLHELSISRKSLLGRDKPIVGRKGEQHDIISWYHLCVLRREKELYLSQGRLVAQIGSLCVAVVKSYWCAWRDHDFL